jgi:hypothetical protein
MLVVPEAMFLPMMIWSKKNKKITSNLGPSNSCINGWALRDVKTKDGKSKRWIQM